MSQSKSPTPTHNRSTNTPKTTEPTTSRLHSLDEHPIQSFTGEQARPRTLRPPSPAPPAPEPQLPEASSSRRRSLIRRAESPAPDEPPMAKRLRRASPQVQSRDVHRSSPSSDSQDDLADNEMEHAKTRGTEPLPPSTTTAKKKRTRTLTTPHQSAVLHALLAQSRFPTTAMREEVGRSIGLSARKVQIWFQNQRQKARRPRTQSDAAVNRPPQYGPFPSSPEQVLGVHAHGEHSTGRSALAGPDAGSLEDPPRLLGPGMPGAINYPPAYPGQGQIAPLPATPGDSGYSLGHTLHRPISPMTYGTSPRMYPPPGPRPATSQPMGWQERDPSRTLPPLLLGTRSSSSRSVARRIHSSSTQPYRVPSRPTLIPPRSISPEPRFAHHPPESSTQPPLSLPPPFTLQPSPQWDQASYAAVPRPSSSPWSHSGSRSPRVRRTSPVTIRREQTGSIAEIPESYHISEHSPRLRSSPRSLPSSSSAPPLRPGRYDPVRASFIPYSSPSVSPVASPARAGVYERDLDQTSSREDT